MKHERNLSMTDELALQWIEWVKTGNDFYQSHIGKALEAQDPSAQDFLTRAKKLDPVFVEIYYPGFEV